MLSIPRHVALRISGLAQVLRPAGLARRHLLPDPAEDAFAEVGVEPLAWARLAGYAA